MEVTGKITRGRKKPGTGKENNESTHELSREKKRKKTNPQPMKTLMAMSGDKKKFKHSFLLGGI